MKNPSPDLIQKCKDHAFKRAVEMKAEARRKKAMAVAPAKKQIDRSENN